MHWPTDTLAGLAVGAVLGILWGTYDPYASLVAANSARLSLAAATGTIGVLLGLLCAVRALVPPVAPVTRDLWYANALRQLSARELRERQREGTEPSSLVQPRTLRSKVRAERERDACMPEPYRTAFLVPLFYSPVLLHRCR